MSMLVPYSPRESVPELADSDREVAEFKLSFGVIGGTVKLHDSKWQRFKARFRKPTAEERQRTIQHNLAIAGADAFIHVNAADDAMIEVQLHLVNFSDYDILVEHVAADFVSVASGPVQLGALTLLPAMPAMGRRSVRVLTMRLAVPPAGIRTMANHIRETQRRPSTPYANLHLRGALLVSQGSVRTAIPFQAHVATPAIDWPTSDIILTGQ
jgi:hypothetical protein